MKLLLPALLAAFTLTAELLPHAAPDEGPAPNPLAGLPYINLTLEEDVFEQRGIQKTPSSRQYYFQVEGDSEFIKIGFTGVNLAEYLTNVPEAYDEVTTYRNLKLTSTVMFFAGLGMTLAGTGATIANGGQSPSILLLLGGAVFSISWIPWWFSHPKIPAAVAAYNAKISEYKAKTPQP